MFNSLNTVITSAAQSAIYNNREAQIKEHAIIRICKNQSLNCQQAMKDWYNFMLIQRLKSGMNKIQRAELVKMMAGLLNNDRKERIKDAIEKFRQSARLGDIQRRFLTRLLNSKIGRVYSAYKQI